MSCERAGIGGGRKRFFLWNRTCDLVFLLLASAFSYLAIWLRACRTALVAIKYCRSRKMFIELFKMTGTMVLMIVCITLIPDL